MQHKVTKRTLFEEAAFKRGYSIEQDAKGLYTNRFLQESWELFCLVNLRSACNNYIY